MREAGDEARRDEQAVARGHRAQHVADGERRHQPDEQGLARPGGGEQGEQRSPDDDARRRRPRWCARPWGCRRPRRPRCRAAGPSSRTRSCRWRRRRGSGRGSRGRRGGAGALVVQRPAPGAHSRRAPDSAAMSHRVHTGSNRCPVQDSRCLVHQTQNPASSPDAARYSAVSAHWQAPEVPRRLVDHALGVALGRQPGEAGVDRLGPHRALHRRGGRGRRAVGQPGREGRDEPRAVERLVAEDPVTAIAPCAR